MLGSYLLIDAEYIPQNTFEELYQQSVETENLIGGFINYLEKHI
tara:strand:+ start:169 stop:300 length:132 start_codon:yes stop_codon:yes gene_type:complete